MNILYFVSGLSNRLITFIAMLVFARILDPENFGRYSVIIGNALFLQVIVGSWISAGSSREFAVSPRTQWPSLLRGIMISIVGVATLLLATALVLGGAKLVPADLDIALAVALLTISLIIFETAQAIQNALEKPAGFAATAVTRGILLLSLGGTVAYLTHSVIAIVVAQMLANLAPIAFAAFKKRSHFKGLQLRGAHRHAKQLTRSGMDGTLMFGYYIVLMAVTKNILAVKYGVALSGSLGLIIDFFFAPLALLSNSVSLSFLPRLYQNGVDGATGIHLRSLPAKFIGLHILLAIVYFVGTNIVIGFIAPPLLPRETGALAVVESGQFSLFAIGIMMMFAVLTILLTSRMTAGLRSIFALGVVAHSAALFWSSSKGHTIPDLLRTISIVQISASMIGIAYLAVLAVRHRPVL